MERVGLAPTLPATPRTVTRRVSAGDDGNFPLTRRAANNPALSGLKGLYFVPYNRAREFARITTKRDNETQFMAIQQLDEQIAQHAQICNNLKDEVGRVLVGQDHMLSRLLIGLLTGGHVLLEGLPGLAKTLTIRSLAKAIDTGFSRIQFTPDMLPSDVIGTEIFNPRESTYVVRKGPIFSNLILADEINRAPAKVQAALLEAMQERQGTIGLETFPLEEPFLVLATQNPIEQEGTYPLPEAQVDRFMLKVVVDYPTKEEERKIVDRMAQRPADSRGPQGGHSGRHPGGASGWSTRSGSTRRCATTWSTWCGPRAIPRSAVSLAWTA